MIVRLTALATVVLLGVSGCEKMPSIKAEHANAPQSSGFVLSLEESKWPASKYCGDVTPQLPENPTPAYRFETQLLTEKLASEAGLTGWVHGAVPRYRQFVFTYRKEDASDPMAFFKSQQFSMIPANADVAKKMQELKRHDKVSLRGSVFDNGSPLVHIKVTALEVLKKYENSTENGYTFDQKLLEGRDEVDVFGMVHATAFDPELGWAVVVERNNYILPVEIDPSQAEAASRLFRGDIINLSLSIVRRGPGPAHFVTNRAIANSLRVVDPILNCHGAVKTVEGTLAKFDKSPAISTDVYAVRYVDSNGMGRNMTFFPASDVSEEQFGEIFMAISAKAKAAWDQSQTEAITVRNFKEKPSIRVKATGMLNVVSTEQANAQVYIHSADDVVFEVLK